MTPALCEGDRFLGWPAGSNTTARRGSVVAFPHPLRSGLWLVKRVVGLGGETISIDTGEVLINGQAGLDLWAGSWSAPDGEWVVPADRVFVLSDQRALTRDDSRSFGPIVTTISYRMVFPPGSRKPITQAT